MDLRSFMSGSNKLRHNSKAERSKAPKASCRKDSKTAGRPGDEGAHPIASGMKIILQIATTVIAGFILALLVSECREIKQTHDAVIRLESRK